ncbi:MAG: UDP-N-acetylmuramate--L-alanine ligase [Oscillospiraceae bacterium]|nr:UDP-N-acetylmuramate--L-alanine ligase [Oscillospiraceae bacterium]
MSSILEGKKHIHMIGIGGSGMYPLAQVLHAKGYYLSGSDNNETDTLAAVRALGIPVTLGQAAENIAGADLVVYSAAIAENNPERAAAAASGVEMMERSELLGLVSEWYSDAVCIAGTHGKTTTTSMLAQILFTAGIDLSAVIGGKLPAIGGSGRAGSSEVFVCEACEYVDTFLHLSPDIAVILNIDEDHMEYFKTLENLKASFTKFAQKSSRYVLYNGDDVNSCEAMAAVTGKTMLRFGTGADCEWRVSDISHTAQQTTTFKVWHNGECLGMATLQIPGMHNVINALAAIASAHLVGLNFAQCQAGLLAFHGAKRRFDVHAHCGGITVADDYGHHPAEIAATLKAAKAMPYRRVIAVHQPFTYSRTERLLDDFAAALKIADIVALTDIMGGRETNTRGVFTRMLAEKIPNCIWFPQDETEPENDQRKYRNFDDVCDAVCRIAEPGDLIITLGCGDVNKLSKLIADTLQSREHL